MEFKLVGTQSMYRLYQMLTDGKPTIINVYLSILFLKNWSVTFEFDFRHIKSLV